MENTIDIIILSAGLLLLLKGFFRGFLKEIFSLAYMVFIILYFPKALPFFKPLKPYFHKIYPVVAVIIIYFAFLFSGILFRMILKKIGAKDFEKSIVDRFLGMLLGIAQSIAIIFILALFSGMGLPSDKFLDDSVLIASFVKKTENKVDLPFWRDRLYDLIQGNFKSAVNSVGDDEDKKVTDIKDNKKITTAKELREALRNTPALNDYFNSPKVQEMIKKGKTQNIIRDPEFLKLMMNPDAVKVFSHIDFKAIKNNVGKK